MGRKRLPDKLKRGKPLRILLRPGERQSIDRAADAAGETSSEWARQTLLNAAQRAAKAGN